VSNKQKSSNWDCRCGFTHFVKEGYPFDEGWPDCSPNDGKVFEIIVRDGKKYFATVDFTTQYRAEGKKWRSVERGQMIEKCVVMAWREM
jgi:hypothetical protein